CHFARAIELTRGWGARGWLVHAIVDYARAVPAPASAADLLAEAEALSAQYGLRPVQERLAGCQ
ncbi:MAG TPA: hypothetical protein VN213_15200, partial [Solirubrobacteraceae bacterium]|nr:hypothetical protein [Solirubrobacteraceae bacterium]